MPQPSQDEQSMKSEAVASGDGSPAAQRPCNLAAALDRLDGDRELLRMLIKIFHEDSVVMLEKLRSATRNRDAREAERNAHSLKGLSANFDGFPAVEAALVVEGAARQGDWQPIIDGLPDLERQIQRLREALAEHQ